MRNSLAATAALAIGFLTLSLGGKALAETCPYRENGYPDGCQQANPHGAFQITPAQFASHGSGKLASGLTWAGAMQSGQKWKANKPWRWDAPGIDYPVGHDATLALQDPATAQKGNGVGQLPPACSYLPNANTASTGGMRVYCSASEGPITISGLDFSRHGCIVLEFGIKFAGTAIVKNNKFANGPNCAVNNASLVNVAAAGRFVFINNTVLGGGSKSPFGFTTVLDNAKTGEAIDEYNYYENIPNRAFSSNRMSVRNRFNYLIGLNTTPNTGLHGEWGLAPSQSFASYTNSFNVVVFDTLSQLNTVSFYVTSAHEMKFASVDHNIIVSNRAGYVAPPLGGRGGGATAKESSISGSTLTIRSGTSGAIAPGQRVSGSGIVAKTQVVGGAGATWKVDQPINVGPTTLTFTPIASTSALLAEMNATTFDTLIIAENYGDATGTLRCIYLQKGAIIKKFVTRGNRSLVTGGRMDEVNAVYPSSNCE
ncbi:MAG: hypothetical protein JWO83_3568 [Caulobacteraceae bacterium]|nr:hypothetical protein [Caulobacteraceae bacterium]